MSSNPEKPEQNPLSPIERQIDDLAKRGAKNQQIASEGRVISGLFLAPSVTLILLGGWDMADGRLSPEGVIGLLIGTAGAGFAVTGLRQSVFYQRQASDMLGTRLKLTEQLARNTADQAALESQDNPGRFDLSRIADLPEGARLAALSQDLENALAIIKLDPDKLRKLISTQEPLPKPENGD